MSVRGRLAVVLGCALLIVPAGLAGASAAEASAWWRLSSRMAPTNLPPGGKGVLDVLVEDVGNSGLSGASSPIAIADVLPAGLEIESFEGVNPHRASRFRNAKEKATEWTCAQPGEREVTCSTGMSMRSYEGLVLEIPVRAQSTLPNHSALVNHASVQGGVTEGTGDAVQGVSVARPLQISDQAVPFGLEADGFSLSPEEEGGAIDVRAGSHPFQLTSTVEFNQTIEEVQEPGHEPVFAPGAPALTRDLSFNLPPGLLGNVTAAARCSDTQFAAFQVGNKCPPESAVGVVSVTLLEPKLGYVTLDVPLFNLEPAQGEPARFGFVADAVPVTLETAVRTGSDYGVTVTVNNATQAAQVLGAQVTFWGDPSSAAHDSSRGWTCLRGEPCASPSERNDTALLTLPTSCTGPLYSSMEGRAWNAEPIGGTFAFQDELGGPLAALAGCPAIPFEPAIGVQPIEEVPTEARQPPAPITSASTPAGLAVSVTLPQQGTVQAGLLAQSDVRSTTVKLPEGMQLNPSAANGLQACSEAQIGYQGPGGEDPLEPGAGEPLRFSDQPVTCPRASKLGIVHIKTPLLDEELTGAVYLAEPAPRGESGKNPFNSLLALYLLAENQTLGIRAKLAGQATLDPQTGQITTVFANTPQVPFEELGLQLFGGPTGSLTTPPACGDYNAQASFTPWTGTPTVNVSSQPVFSITSGPDDTPCASSQPFSPGFQAGSTNPRAGALTPFSLTLQHADGDQALQGLTVHLPSGIAALLANVTPCPEPLASRDECTPDSLIGHSTAYSGFGPDPIGLPGRVYLTGPYEGAPFGIAVVTPAVAGPFDLGDVTVRSRINVDPNTAAVTITSDPFPTFVRGVPVDLKGIDVLVDRPNFEFNPTSCNPMSITGALTGVLGASEKVSSPFQVSGCENLPFKPVFQASTSGNATKANGASFVVKVASKGLGEADIEKVDLQLPKALPARLTTLQKACTEGAFDTNPASCPEGSVIGTAIIHTPVLKNPLSGPAYLVSHGGAAFPDVEFVLQGENITLVLDGKTAIKNQITYSKFEAAPDAPFTTFETILPQGPHSALTSNVPAKAKFSLCGQTLQMPTEITAHNGAVIKQATKIAVQGCAAVKSSRAKKLTRAQLLALALKTCHKKFKHNKHKRQTCERQARKRFELERTSARKHKARTSS
jgi:hypothetical protein